MFATDKETEDAPMDIREACVRSGSDATLRPVYRLDEYLRDAGSRRA